MSKKSSATKRLLWILGGLLILLVAFAIVGRVTGMFGSGNSGTFVETDEAESRSITQIVTASGRVQPEVEVIISPDVSGEIIELPIKEGDTVQRGMLLARIKPDFYATQVEQARAGVLQAKASMVQREADLLEAESERTRQRDLFERAAIAKSVLEQAETRYNVAEAGLEGAKYAVESAEARLREAEEQVRKTAIYSPMSGTISVLLVELGERVVGTSQMAGTEMMRVARLDHMEVEVEVNENEIVNVALGDTASIEVDAYPERNFRGVVTEIANSARTTAAGTQEQVTEFPVKVRILDAHNIQQGYDNERRVIVQDEVPVPVGDAPLFRPGMSATVDVYTETVVDVVAVPIQAVTVRDLSNISLEDTNGDAETEEENGEKVASDSSRAGPGKEELSKVVFVVVDGTAQIVEVETGISDDTHIEVATGLAAGDQVVTGPYSAVSRTLNHKDQIRIRENDTPDFSRAGS